MKYGNILGHNIEYWLEDDNEDIDESDVLHIAGLIEEGYIEGELNHGEQEIRGYWKIVK